MGRSCLHTQALIVYLYIYKWFFTNLYSLRKGREISFFFYKEKKKTRQLLWCLSCCVHHYSKVFAMMVVVIVVVFSFSVIFCCCCCCCCCYKRNSLDKNSQCVCMLTREMLQMTTMLSGFVWATKKNPNLVLENSEYCLSACHPSSCHIRFVFGVEFTCFGLLSDYDDSIWRERKIDEEMEKKKKKKEEEENSSFSSFVYGSALPSCYNN